MFKLRTLLLLLVVFSLLFGSVAVALAQEEGGGEGDGETTTVVDEGEEAGGTNVLDALGLNAGFLIAQMVNFLLIASLLTVILWRPVTNMLDGRATKIAKGLEDAAAAANARRNAEAEAEKILSQARTEAQKLIEEARMQGEEVAKSIDSEARADAEKTRAAARTDIEAERNQELAGLRDQVKSISVAIAERLIGETISSKKQDDLISSFFTRLPAGAKNLSGAVTVVSAMPLTDAEQKRVTKEIGAADVTFAVDPNILGGLVIRTGERVIDGSVRSGLTDLSASLN